MPSRKTENTVTGKKTSERPRKSRVAEIAEDLRIVAGDTVKEVGEKIGAASEKVLEDVVKAEGTVKEAAKEVTAAAKAKVPVKKAAPAKKAVKAKKETKAPAKKATAKAQEKKPAAPRSKKAAGPAIVIQSIMGGEITVNEILNRISLQTSETITAVYIKAEENRAYYVAGEEGGYIDLWR